MKYDKKVLIVEDEPSLAKAIDGKLKREGFETKIAKNGEEGLSMALEYKPDLILLDIIMPIMSGIEVLNKLRDDEWGANVEIIILTNLSGGQEISEAIQKGVYDYLVKTDWELNDVVQVVKNKLNIN